MIQNISGPSLCLVSTYFLLLLDVLIEGVKKLKYDIRIHIYNIYIYNIYIYILYSIIYSCIILSETF